MSDKFKVNLDNFSLSGYGMTKKLKDLDIDEGYIIDIKHNTSVYQLAKQIGIKVKTRKTSSTECLVVRVA